MKLENRHNLSKRKWLIFSHLGLESSRWNLCSVLCTSLLFSISGLSPDRLTVPHWLCDFRRCTYFISNHMVKWSLLTISLERMLAIRYPYKYARQVQRRYIILLLLILWCITITIDTVPMYNGRLVRYDFYWNLSGSALRGCPISPFFIRSCSNATDCCSIFLGIFGGHLPRRFKISKKNQL